jgi:hypothetical protein
VSTILVLVLQAATLISILFSAVKVINRNIDEWRQRETRMAAVEQRLTEVERDAKLILSIIPKIDDMVKEIERMRNRLDLFLDRKTTEGD